MFLRRRTRPTSIKCRRSGLGPGLSLRYALGGTPLLDQRPPAPGIAGAGIGQGADTVGTKMPVSHPKLAPRRENPHPVEEADRDRPDHALAEPVGTVAIGDRNLMLTADGRPQGSKVDAIWGNEVSGTGKQAGGIDGLAEIARQDRPDLRQSVLCRGSERRVRALRHPARSQNQGL